MTYRWDTSGKTPRRVRVERVKCSECSGEGKHFYFEGTCFARYFTHCERCDGKGYLEKEMMGKTISYSSARQKYNDTLPSPSGEKAQYGHRQILDWYGYLELCDALEEREREVERLREALKAVVYDTDMKRNRWGLWRKTREALAASEAEREEDIGHKRSSGEAQ